MIESMKKVLPWFMATACILVAGWIAMTGNARAQDAPKWTGCGVSASVGMAASKTEASAQVAGITLLGIDGLGTSGAEMGLGVNCDLQVDRFVVGAFADWVRHDQSFTVSSIAGTLAKLDFENQWSLGGRAGVLVHPTTLVYGLIAYTQVQTSDIASPFLTLAVPDIKGWSIGGGIETSLGSGLFLGAEYRFSMLDDVTIGLGPAALVLDPEVHSVKAKLAWKFGLEK